MARWRQGAQEVTPHESKIPEDDHTFGRWCLMALQVLAMALSFCLLARMWMEYELELPHQMCVEVQRATHAAAAYRSAE